MAGANVTKGRKRMADQDTKAGEMGAVEAAQEVVALAEVAAHYLQRLQDTAVSDWAKLAMSDLVDTAVDIKATAKQMVSSEGKSDE